MIKVITEIRRCGKSYLLMTIFRNFLLEEGVKNDHIITLDLENKRNIRLRDPDDNHRERDNSSHLNSLQTR